MVKRGRAPILSAASARRAACASGQMRIDCRPPRRDSSGSAVERRLRPAEMVDELAEGDRPDVVAADQSQAGQPLGGVERRLRQRRRRQPRAGLEACLPIGLPRGRTTWRRSCSPRRRADGGCWRGAWRKSEATMMRMSGNPAHPRDRVDRGRRQRSPPARPARNSACPAPPPSQTTQKTSAASQCSAEQHADIGGDALAALEVQPDRVEVAQEGAEPGQIGELEGLERL